MTACSACAEFRKRPLQKKFWRAWKSLLCQPYSILLNVSLYGFSYSAARSACVGFIVSLFHGYFSACRGKSSWLSRGHNFSLRFSAGFWASRICGAKSVPWTSRESSIVKKCWTRATQHSAQILFRFEQDFSARKFCCLCDVVTRGVLEKWRTR